MLAATLVLCLLAAPQDAAPAARRALPCVAVVTATDSAQKPKHGAAFCVDPRGVFVTSYHLVAHRTPTLQLQAGAVLKATVLYADPETDLAVLQADPKAVLLLKAKGTPLQALKLAPAAPEVGSCVLAVGHPAGKYPWTVSRGVISAAGRAIELPGGRALEGLLQTDAAISPGCSGGPLVNLKGEAVGVVTALSSEANGVAFAVPAAAVRDVLTWALVGKE